MNRSLPNAAVLPIAVVLLATAGAACASEPMADPPPEARGSQQAPAADGDVAPVDDDDVPETVAGIERLGDLEIPAEAEEVEVSTVGGTSSRRAVFTLPVASLEPWCRDLGLGQPLARARELSDQDRDRFAIAEGADLEAVLGCEGSAPGDPQLQRAVVATGTDGEDATVHLVVQRSPGR